MVQFGTLTLVLAGSHMFTPNSNPLKSSAMTSGYDKIKHPPDPSCEMTHGFGSCLDNFGASPNQLGRPVWVSS